MRYLHIQPGELPRIKADDLPGLLRHARQMRAQERMEFISDMRCAIAQTKEALDAAQGPLAALAQQAAGGDDQVLARYLLDITATSGPEIG